MKKQYTILFFLLFNCGAVIAQTFVKTTTPCNAELLKKTPGRWMPIGTSLPKYIPQLMIYSCWDCRCGPDQSLNPYKLYEENFPIEKLQAMIDK
jgi:hypothetical protein